MAVVLVLLACEPYYTYFDRWAANPEMPQAFDSAAADMARQLRSLPAGDEKYVVYPPGADMTLQPVMFLTASYTARGQTATHIHYVASADCTRARQDHPGARVFCLTGN
jgi:hypothetical protein